MPALTAAVAAGSCRAAAQACHIQRPTSQPLFVRTSTTRSWGGLSASLSPIPPTCAIRSPCWSAASIGDQRSASERRLVSTAATLAWSPARAELMLLSASACAQTWHVVSTDCYGKVGSVTSCPCAGCRILRRRYRSISPASASGLPKQDGDSDGDLVSRCAAGLPL